MTTQLAGMSTDDIVFNFVNAIEANFMRGLILCGMGVGKLTYVLQSEFKNNALESLSDAGSGAEVTQLFQQVANRDVHPDEPGERHQALSRLKLESPPVELP